MAKYQIHRWDPVIIKNNNMPYPMIYIKPDKAFSDFAKNNSYAILVNIENTGTIYDGKRMIATVGSLECDRPHMMNKTGLCTITLYAHWYGYPPMDRLGVAAVSGLVGEDSFKAKLPAVKKWEAPKPVVQVFEHYNNPSTKDNLTNSQICMIFISIAFLFLVLWWISYVKKNVD